MVSNSKLPNFFIIGAQKAGTSSVHHYLNQHPQIFMSPKKEPQYFSFGRFMGSDKRLRKKTKMVYSWEDYIKLFSNVKEEVIIGESSTTYLINENAASGIVEKFPNAKLMAILRQPADRAYSQWLFNRKRFYEPLNNFNDALYPEKSRGIKYKGQRFKYRENGKYYEALKRYLDIFSKNQILIVLYDELKEDPLNLLGKIQDFLELDSEFNFDVSVKYNVSGEPRNIIVDRLLRLIQPIRKDLEHKLPPKLVGFMGRHLMRRPKYPKDLIKELTLEYKEDILKLQRLIEIDLSNWLKPLD